jgi:EAL domain-containing protein (putative c-di-GMP-specific phosphodiesterase class I)
VGADAEAVRGAAELLGGWRLQQSASVALAAAIPHATDARAVVLTTDNPNAQRDVVAAARHAGLAVVAACRDETARRRAAELRVDDWYRTPGADAEEVAARVRTALTRAGPGSAFHERAERTEYEGLLYDARSGIATLPVAIERSRSLIAERGEMVVLYLNFVRYSKLEELYGWERLDAVLETTTEAVRGFLGGTALAGARAVVSFSNDADLVLFHVPSAGQPVATDPEITELSGRLATHVAQRLEAVHGEDVATLCDIYVGAAHVQYTPKVRLERLVYRGVREAAHAAKSVAERERWRKVADLRQLLRERAVYVDYHPIVQADTQAVAGYEALARGQPRALRSPEVLFEVAAEADLSWELGRLCRARAVEGMQARLGPGQLLFLNADPHDFADPEFTPEALQVADPRRVVIEITERTAIKDYPRFRGRLEAFRQAGFRFAVDDAGSGYAGLGSIANLEPDFIKLDMSLIHCIDTNFIKQHLVESMVRFADDQGAQVIAEGVERREEYETVRALGVHLVQGFYLHEHAPPRTPTTDGAG